MGKKDQFHGVLPTQDRTPLLFCLCDHLHTHTPHGRATEVTASEFCVSPPRPHLLAYLHLTLHSSQLSLSLHFCFKRHRTSTLRCHLHITSTSPPARLHLPHTPSSLPITTRRWTEALRPSHHTRSQTTLSPPLQHPTLKGHALIYFPASLLSRPL